MSPRLPAAVATLLLAGAAHAQAWRAGLEGSYGTQQSLPFGNNNYTHDFTGYKLLLNRELEWPRPLGLELQIEPSLYVEHHRLLNMYFVGPHSGPDYLTRRARYLHGVTIHEYALNVGLQWRVRATRALSFFVLGSIGPMWSDTATERLARGLAFSDIVAVGVGYRLGGALLEVRPGLRHESNAQTQLPNSGHNAVTLDVALSFGL